MTFNKKMNQYGYKKVREGTLRSYPEWVKLIKEDLDDKDEFVRDCYTCRTTPNSENMPGFHGDHIQAGQKAAKLLDKMTWAQRQSKAADRLWTDAFHKEMDSLGYAFANSHWVKPLKEDLDDQDTFMDCDYCAASPIQSQFADLQDDFHVAHVRAHDLAAYTGGEAWTRHYHSLMAERGWKRSQEGWVRTTVKESLDDEDEFEIEPEIDIDEYIVEYWGMNAASNVMLTGAKEYGWVPKSLGRWEQFEDIKTQFPDLYEAAVEVARESM